MIQIQRRHGYGWQTVTTREGAEMDFPAPVSAATIGVARGDVCRLALTENGRILRKRMVYAV